MQPETTEIEVVVVDDFGCDRPLEDIEVEIEIIIADEDNGNRNWTSFGDNSNNLTENP